MLTPKEVGCNRLPLFNTGTCLRAVVLDVAWILRKTEEKRDSSNVERAYGMQRRGDDTVAGRSRDRTGPADNVRRGPFKRRVWATHCRVHPEPASCDSCLGRSYRVCSAD